MKPRKLIFLVVVSALALAVTGRIATAQGSKPNILVLWGDDIGITNISAYSDGLMGYETPNIDRIGNEGIRFLHYYGGGRARRDVPRFPPASTDCAPASPGSASRVRRWA
jgi:hypothetical protein